MVFETGSGANEMVGVLNPPAPYVTASQFRNTHCVNWAKARVERAR
jgi:hypothetical protein